MWSVSNLVYAEVLAPVVALVCTGSSLGSTVAASKQALVGAVLGALLTVAAVEAAFLVSPLNSGSGGGGNTPRLVTLYAFYFFLCLFVTSRRLVSHLGKKLALAYLTLGAFAPVAAGFREARSGQGGGCDDAAAADDDGSNFVRWDARKPLRMIIPSVIGAACTIGCSALVPRSSSSDIRGRIRTTRRGRRREDGEGERNDITASPHCFRTTIGRWWRWAWRRYPSRCAVRELCRRLRFQASAARALCRLHMLLVLTADASLVAHADVVLAAAEDNARELSGELLAAADTELRILSALSAPRRLLRRLLRRRRLRVRSPERASQRRYLAMLLLALIVAAAAVIIAARNDGDGAVLLLLVPNRGPRFAHV